MNKPLIVYYSLFQNTKRVAEEIADQTGGTLKELIAENHYSFDYNTAAREVRNQISRGFCPKLISGNASIEKYDTIFVGTPNWFKTMAPPVKSFLRLHDFTGKKIAPFCTHGGGGFGQMEKEMKNECSKGSVLQGLAVGGTFRSEEICNWLDLTGVTPH